MRASIRCLHGEVAGHVSAADRVRMNRDVCRDARTRHRLMDVAGSSLPEVGRADGHVHMMRRAVKRLKVRIATLVEMESRTVGIATCIALSRRGLQYLIHL